MGLLRKSLSSTRNTGTYGERVAVAHLQAKGYNIIARNYRRRFGEIDIIAWHHGVLVFIEVKTRKTQTSGTPWEAVDRRKQRQISRVALDYLTRNRLEEHPVRFDVVAVFVGRDRQPRIQVLENAFEACF